MEYNGTLYNIIENDYNITNKMITISTNIYAVGNYDHILKIAAPSFMFAGAEEVTKRGELVNGTKYELKVGREAFEGFFKKMPYLKFAQRER